MRLCRSFKRSLEKKAAIAMHEFSSADRRQVRVRSGCWDCGSPPCARLFHRRYPQPCPPETGVVALDTLEEMRRPPSASSCQKRIGGVRLQVKLHGTSLISCRTSFIGVMPPRRCCGRSKTTTSGNCSVHCSLMSSLSVSMTILSICGARQHDVHHMMKQRTSVAERTIVFPRHALGTMPHGHERDQTMS